MSGEKMFEVGSPEWALQRRCEEEQRRLKERVRRLREEQLRLEEEQRRQEEERQGRLEEKRKILRKEEEARTKQVMLELAAKNQPAPRVEIERTLPASISEIKDSALPPAPERDLNADCRRIFDRLKSLNNSAATRHDSLMKEVEAGTDPKRLSLILDDLKLSYGRELTLAARNNCLRREVKDLLAACKAGVHPEDFQAKLRALLGADNLTEEDVQAAWIEFDDLSAKKDKLALLGNMAGMAGKVLKEMGYQVMDAEGLTLDHTQYLTTPDPKCRIQCYINSQSGRVAFKQVRVVASEAEAAAPLTDYQKALDRKNGEAWCQTFDRMLDRLNEAGYPIEIMLRREAGHGELPVVTDDLLASGRRQARSPAVTTQKQNLS
jgi:hypothetical protein